MKNTGVTLITGLSGSGKTTLLNLFVANRGEEKLHIFIEEDMGMPLDTLKIQEGATITPFSLGNEDFISHDAEFNSLMDLALEALRPTQFLCEIRDTSSLPRVLLEMTRAGVVNVRIVTCVDGPEVNAEFLETPCFKEAASVSDAIWLCHPTDEAKTLLTKGHGAILAHREQDFNWFPVLKGWQRPLDILERLNPIPMENPWHTLDFSAFGTFKLEELSAFLDNHADAIHRVKGALFCREEPSGEPLFYTLSGKHGEYHFELADFKKRIEAFTDEEDLLTLIGQEDEDLEEYEDGNLLATLLSLRVPAETTIDEELALSRELEKLWHFEVPWETQEPLSDQEIDQVLTADPDSLEPDWATTLCYGGLKRDNPLERAPFHERLGLIERELEDLYSALTHSRFAVALGTTAEKLEEMARCCNNLDDYPYAVRLLEQALKVDPELKSALQNIIRLHLVYGHPKKGLPYLEQVMGLDPSDWENIILSSYVYFETNNYEKLVALYQANKDACDASSDFLLTLASAHLDHNATKKSLKVLDQLYTMDPENDGILYLKGYALLIEGEMEAARDTLIKAIAMGNEISWVYLALGLAMEYLGDKREAHQTLQKAFEVAQDEFEDDPTHRPFVEVAILTHIAVGMPREAQEIMDNAGHNMKYSHEFKNFVKLLSCFKLPEGLSEATPEVS